MDWIEKIEATIVGIDTAPFIYFMEEDVTYLPLLQPFFEAMEHGASFWLTNDKRLPAIPRLTTLLLDKLRPKT